jgi:hypothetical protein
MSEQERERENENPVIKHWFDVDKWGELDAKVNGASGKY